MSEAEEKSSKLVEKDQTHIRKHKATPSDDDSQVESSDDEKQKPPTKMQRTNSSNSTKSEASNSSPETFHHDCGSQVQVSQDSINAMSRELDFSSKQINTLKSIMKDEIKKQNEWTIRKMHQIAKANTCLILDGFKKFGAKEDKESANITVDDETKEDYLSRAKLPMAEAGEMYRLCDNLSKDEEYRTFMVIITIAC